MIKDFNLDKPVFPLEGNPTEFALMHVEHLDLSVLPFENKSMPSSEDRKKAIILWGPPGSGKTTFARDYIWDLCEGFDPEFISQTIGISYDEDILGNSNGALFNIPEYRQIYDQQKWSSTPDRDLLATLYRKYRSDAQRIRSITLNYAFQDGCHLCIDITSAGAGVFKLIETLHAHGYEIGMIGVIAPLDLAVQRSEQRLRMVEPEEVFTKRDGAFRTFAKLMNKADQVVLLNNSADGESPKRAFSVSHGKIMQRDEAVIRDIAAQIEMDALFCETHPIGQKYTADIKQSSAAFLETIMKTITPQFRRQNSVPGAEI